MDDFRARITESFGAQSLMATLGARLVLVEEGEVHILLPNHERLLQQHGYVHAGALTSIVDTACGYAALSKAPEGHEVVSVEFKINFLRPAVGQGFLAIGRVQRSGKLITVCTGEVRTHDQDEPRVIALMQATIMNVPR